MKWARDGLLLMFLAGLDPYEPDPVEPQFRSPNVHRQSLVML